MLGWPNFVDHVDRTYVDVAKMTFDVAKTDVDVDRWRLALVWIVC